MGDLQERFELSPFVEMMEPRPGPTEVLGKICDEFLSRQVGRRAGG